MTDREQRLRERIDLLAGERDALEVQRDELAMRLLDATKEKRVGGWCAYCGDRLPFNRRVCRAHSDLPRLEAA